VGCGEGGVWVGSSFKRERRGDLLRREEMWGGQWKEVMGQSMHNV